MIKKKDMYSFSNNVWYIDLKIYVVSKIKFSNFPNVNHVSEHFVKYVSK